MNLKHKLVITFVIVILAFLPFINVKEEQSVAADVDYAQLGHEINKILQDERVKGATVGVSVRHATTGELIYNHSGDTRLHPASNMKLLTGAAALETLGEDYRFSTEVLADGKVAAGVLQGNIYLKGKGDPTLLEKDFDLLAKNLITQGIKTVKGNLIGDDTWYDNDRLSPDITLSDESYYYAAQVSALTASPNDDYDAGTVIVEAHPNKKVGEPATFKVTPEIGVVKVINRSITGKAGAEKDLLIERQHGTNTILITGTVPKGGPVTREWIAVWEPSNYALHLFKKSLDENGIKFTGQSKVVLGKTPSNAVILTSKESMPLRDLFIPFMKLSNNAHAEILTKEMGKVVYGEGSWENGIRVIEETAVKLGMNKETIMIRDGSGLSQISLIPANELTELLYAVQAKPWYNAFLNSLPIAGIKDRFVGGSLRNRMKTEPTVGNVRAKTGSLTSVSSLSGYATTKDGELLVFSILINNDLETVTPIEDQIATVIASYTKTK
nr:D-alanyl-D-alanine carboxypeptidase/D-alanyl-D-alanine-endopeptidase [Paenisporosarcina indica]